MLTLSFQFFRDLLGITIEQEMESKPEKPSIVKDEEIGVFGAEVNKSLSTQIAFLNNDGQFPLPAALGNIVKQLKREISKMSTRSVIIYIFLLLYTIARTSTMFKVGSKRFLMIISRDPMTKWLVTSK